MRIFLFSGWSVCNVLRVTCSPFLVILTITESAQGGDLKLLHGLGNIGFILAKLVRVSILVSGKKRY